MSSEKGFAHLFLIAIILVGIVAGLFLLKNPAIFKPRADTTGMDSSYNLGVLVIKYFPLTSNGQNIDSAVTGDVGDSYQVIRQKTTDITNNLLSLIPKSSKYLGYSNQDSQPALNLILNDVKEYTQAVPILGDGTRRPNYNKIMTDNNICDYVDNKNVREVFLWAYQGPNYPGTNTPYLAISESKMAGPFGDISNSFRLNDMPKCSNTYRVYTFNYGRGTAEAIESWSHQIEAEMSEVNSDFFRNKWQGPNYPQTLKVNGRCGSAHNPPNARSEYDRGNTIAQKSDCLDWNPDGLGALSDISCTNWGCSGATDKDNPALNYMVWNWQNLPGRNNLKNYQGKKIRNLWDIHGDFDRVMRQDKTIFISASNPPKTGFTLASGTQQVASGGEFYIKAGVSSDIDAANLFSLVVDYPIDKVQMLDISPPMGEATSSGDTFVKKWIEQSDDKKGKIILSGAVPNPGLKTDPGQTYTMATIRFKSLISSGEIPFVVNSESAIYRNSDNQNIISSNANAKVIIGSVSPSPSGSGIPAVDSDKDGFLDGEEMFYGTDPNKSCGVNAWPPDLNDDKGVNGTDVSLMVPYIDGTKLYDKRHDLNRDGRIDQVGDIPVIQKYMLQTCTVSSPSPSPSPSSTTPVVQSISTLNAFPGTRVTITGQNFLSSATTDVTKLQVWLIHSSGGVNKVAGVSPNVGNTSWEQSSISFTIGVGSNSTPQSGELSVLTGSSLAKVPGIFTISAPVSPAPSATPIPPVINSKRADLYNDPNKPNFVNDQDVSVFYTKCAANGLEFFGKPASVQPVCDILEDGKITVSDWSVLIKFRNQSVQ